MPKEEELTKTNNIHSILHINIDILKMTLKTNI